MPIYVALYKWTEQGVRNIKEVPARIQSSIQAAEGFGGKILGVYLTMGDYDLVSIGEWPNDEAASTTALAIASRGTVRTTTMRAFTPEEFAEIVKKLP
jgi:uncharacterized protein with GYD domain